MKNTALCSFCNRQWIILSSIGNTEGPSEVMAAHDCDGIGVVAIWHLEADGSWRVREANTEEGIATEPNLDGVPPPTRAPEAPSAEPQRPKSASGTLSISRPTRNFDEDHPIIRVVVKRDHQRLVLEASAEDFMLALTGRAEMPCTIEES